MTQIKKIGEDPLWQQAMGTDEDPLRLQTTKTGEGLLMQDPLRLQTTTIDDGLL